MTAVRSLLKLLTYLIYVCYGLTLVTFPVANLLEYIARETRLFAFHFSFPIEDVILPGLLLGILYAGIMVLQRRLQPKSLPESQKLKEEHLASS